MVKNICQCKRPQFDPWVGGDPLEKGMATHLPGVFLPGEFHGQRSLGSYSPGGCQESDTTEKLTFSFFSPFFQMHPRLMSSFTEIESESSSSVMGQLTWVGLCPEE